MKLKQAGPPKEVLTPAPINPAHLTQRQRGIPPQFQTTDKAMTKEAEDGETAGANGTGPNPATQPGAAGTGLQGLPSGVRDVLTSADSAHWHVP